jgi:four helix bundle protein
MVLVQSSISKHMRKELIEQNPLLKHSFAFSLLVIQYCELLEAKKKFIVARQLFRSGTSIGANAMEAQNAESKVDFIHKIKLAAKEAGETQYWLLICAQVVGYPECKLLIEKVEEINRIIGSILSTAKRRSPFSYLVSLFL